MENDLAVPIDNHRTLWLTEISRHTFEDQSLDDLGTDGGLFVVLEDTSDGKFEVLAKASSAWAGASLLSMMAEALRPKSHLALVKS